MIEMIRYEIYKLLHKPLVWASLAGILLFVGVMEWRWVAPGYAAIQADVNGHREIILDFAAIKQNQEIAARYAGPLTTETVKEILDTYLFSDEMLKESGLDPERQGHYTHNLLYDTFSQHGFTTMAGEWNGSTIEDIYGQTAPDLILGYSAGWEDTIYAIIYCFLSWGCVLVILLSPLFCGEYDRHMDALILTGRQGRRKVPLAKITAAFIVSVGGSVLLIAVFFFTLLAAHGVVGFESSVQLGEMGLLFNTPYMLSWAQAFGFTCLLLLGAVTVLTALLLVVSALSKSSFSSLVISFVLFVAPMFIPWHKLPYILNLAGCLLPINQMQVNLLFSFDKIYLGNLGLNVMWLALPAALAAGLAGILWSKRAFARH
ncbi:MAG: hypothetical protein K2G28_09420, partial [Acetatifactor sp.]|nr:hypothetical protein [Acetatifactor sp.]